MGVSRTLALGLVLLLLVVPILGIGINYGVAETIPSDEMVAKRWLWIVNNSIQKLKARLETLASKTNLSINVSEIEEKISALEQELRKAAELIDEDKYSEAIALLKTLMTEISELWREVLSYAEEHPRIHNATIAAAEWLKVQIAALENVIARLENVTMQYVNASDLKEQVLEILNIAKSKLEEAKNLLNTSNVTPIIVVKARKLVTEAKRLVVKASIMLKRYWLALRVAKIMELKIEKLRTRLGLAINLTMNLSDIAKLLNMTRLLPVINETLEKLREIYQNLSNINLSNVADRDLAEIKEILKQAARELKRGAIAERKHIKFVILSSERAMKKALRELDNVSKELPPIARGVVKGLLNEIRKAMSDRHAMKAKLEWLKSLCHEVKNKLHEYSQHFKHDKHLCRCIEKIEKLVEALEKLFELLKNLPPPHPHR